MCLNPIKIKLKNDTTDGKYKKGEEIEVNCGQCIICRMKRASDWTIKLVNESKYHMKSCFVTLTFDNKILADANSKYECDTSFLWNIKYSKKYVQKFIKRIRKHFKDKDISYYAVGEYGDKFKRCHWHILFFGINFDEDRTTFERSKTGHEQYYSDTLQELWSAGRTSIQDINSHNIAYIAGYSVKKIKNPSNIDEFRKNYNKIEYETSEIAKDENGNEIYYTDEKGKRKKLHVIKTKYEWKYKPTFMFSNRSKMNSKWIYKRPEEILRGYLLDNDKKKYAIPRSYREALKKSDNIKHQKYSQIIEERIEEYSENIDKQLKKMEENAKAKMKIAEMRRNPRADF